MNEFLTHSSAIQYQQISSGEMSPEMAAGYLRDQRIPLRGFADTLREMYPYPDLQFRLTNAFRETAGAAPPSVTRKVHNWLSGSSRPSDREDIFRIAFTLDLSEGQAGALLGLCTDCGIHYREGRDLVYAWFLRHDLGYQEARAFYLTLPPVPPEEERPETASDAVTQELLEAFLPIQTIEELRERYVENLSRMGTFHLRAYRYFQRYLDYLVRPSPPGAGTRRPATPWTR